MFSEINDEIINNGKKNAIIFGIGIVSSAIIAGIVLAIKSKKKKNKSIKPEIFLPEKQEVPQVNEDQVEETDGKGYSSTEEAVEAMLKILHGSEKD